MSENDDAAAAAFRAWLYTQHNPAHSRRTASQNARFFIPLLQPGMRLLDAGCGPGSITIGLAAAVAPRETVGVDANAASIEQARAAARAAGVASVRFETADIHALPFEDGVFDAVFVHAVLQHLADPAVALRELCRVLRPGGVIGVADADFGGSIAWPDTPEMRHAIDLMVRVRSFSGGDPFVGRRLRVLLLAAGFREVSGSVAGGADWTEDGNLRVGEHWAAHYESPEMVRYATAAGVATEDELRAASAAWREWGMHKGSFWARWWCQATGRKPA